MKTALTPQQVELYQREGWLIIEDFLTSDELQEMRSAVSETVTEMGETRIADGGSINKRLFKDVKPFNRRVFLQRVNLWKINDTVKKYFLNPDLGEMLCKLADIDGIRMWHDQTLQKLAWDNPYILACGRPKLVVSLS